VRRIEVVLFIALASFGASARLFAQTAADVSRVEISAGVRWIGSLDLASVPANETTLGGGQRALFDSTTTLDRSFGGTVTVGVRLSQLIRVEGSAVYSPTQLITRVTDDTEGAPDTAISAPVTQILVEGGVVATPPPWRTRHVSPFVTAGIGYLRQLNDGRTLVETGGSYYVGGGLYYVRTSTRPGRVKATGLRADVRALGLHHGVAPDSDWRAAPAITATFFMRF
jgi:hypothetical protein